MLDRSKKIQAFFYATPNRNEPVREWLLALSPSDRKAVGRDIQKVEFGWPLGMPYCRSLGDGLWEVRSNLDDGKIARVIFGIVDSRMVLLHSFIKKTQRTPEQDLALGRKCWKEIALNGR